MLRIHSVPFDKQQYSQRRELAIREDTDTHTHTHTHTIHIHTHTHTHTHIHTYTHAQTHAEATHGIQKCTDTPHKTGIKHARRRIEEGYY